MVTCGDVRGGPTPGGVVWADHGRALRELLDALVCGPVDTAAMLLPALRARGLRIGEDLLLACATDSTTCTVTDPPITAIDRSPRPAGRRCAELLDAVLGGTALEDRRIEVPLRVVHRASTRGRWPRSRRGAAERGPDPRIPVDRGRELRHQGASLS